MDTTNVSRGALIAGASAVLLLIFMFFKWYGVEASVSGVPEEFGFPGIESAGSGNAWQAFSLIDIILFLCIAGVVALVTMEVVGAGVTLPVAPSVAIAGLGAIAFVLILFRLIVTPDLGTGEAEDLAFGGIETDVDVTRKIGLFLGFLASIGMAIGGWLAMQDEGASFGDVGGGTGSGAGAAPPPATPPQQPPPPPAGGSQPPPAPPPPSGQ